MSRIGNLPIKIPKDVTVSVEKHIVTVKGSGGSLEQSYNPLIDVAVKDSQVIVSRKNESKKAKSFHGLYRNLIHNMITGVSTGFTKVLLISGVGYRAEVQGNILTLYLGFSSPISYVIEDSLKISVEQNTKIIVQGISKQQVGQTCAEIRSLRPPEPYKGKGIRYEDEYVRRKIGKAGVK